MEKFQQKIYSGKSQEISEEFRKRDGKNIEFSAVNPSYEQKTSF